MEMLDALKKTYLVYASTGIAATLLPNGRTLHSGFRLPIKIDGSSECNIIDGTPQFAKFKAAAVIFIDEDSMMSNFILSAVHRCLQRVTGCYSKPFGGKVMVLGGDFRQLLPVVPRAPKAVVIQNSILKNPLWDEFQVN